MTITDSLLKVRTELEDNLRNLLGIPVYLIELDAFALPCGCSGATINRRGFTVDDIEVFEEHILKFLEEATLKLEIQPSFLFARLIPGTAEVASLMQECSAAAVTGILQEARGNSPVLTYIFSNSKRTNKSIPGDKSERFMNYIK